MDEIGLQDVAGLREVIHGASQLKLICNGHIHQEFAGELEGVPVRSVPSAAIQFRPRRETLEVDSLSPGYRVIQLGEEGRFETDVVRVG